MNKYIKIFTNIFFKFFKVYIFRDKFLLSAKKWFNDDGDNLLRLNYNLNQESIVFDVGGYEGDFSKKIYDKYHSNIYIFEPVESFYLKISNRFKDIDKINMYQFGLSNLNKTIEISLSKDASSIHIESQKKETIVLKSIIKFINENKIDKIDLIKINIEGGEFDLLPSLLDNEIINRIDNLQIQFHTFIEDAERKREIIRKKLAKTHELTYDYYFIWENWKLKSCK